MFLFSLIYILVLCPVIYDNELSFTFIFALPNPHILLL